MDLHDLLQSTPMFSAFSAHELQLLERAFAVTRHPNGHHFTREGERGHGFYVVVEGKVNVVRRRKDRSGTDVVRTLEPGEVFGFVSLLDLGPSTASCIADGEVTVASLPKQAFDLLLNRQASIAQHFQVVVARELAAATGGDADGILELLRSGDKYLIRAMIESASDAEQERAARGQ